jgi:hypothetical protein
MFQNSMKLSKTVWQYRGELSGELKMLHNEKFNDFYRCIYILCIRLGYYSEISMQFG